MRFGDREGPRGALVQPVSGETRPGCGHFTTESAARQVRTREKQKAGTKNPCLGVWYGSCGGKPDAGVYPSTSSKNRKFFFSQFLLYPTALAIEKHLLDPMSRCFSDPYFSRITGHWAVTAVWMSLAASSGERSSCSPLCIFFTEHRPFSISSSPRRTA